MRSHFAFLLLSFGAASGVSFTSIHHPLFESLYLLPCFLNSSPATLREIHSCEVSTYSHSQTHGKALTGRRAVQNFVYIFVFLQSFVFKFCHCEIISISKEWMNLVLKRPLQIFLVAGWLVSLEVDACLCKTFQHCCYFKDLILYAGIAEGFRGNETVIN